MIWADDDEDASGAADGAASASFSAEVGGTARAEGGECGGDGSADPEAVGDEEYTSLSKLAAAGAGSMGVQGRGERGGECEAARLICGAAGQPLVSEVSESGIRMCPGRGCRLPGAVTVSRLTARDRQ
jgi:hypothetical protein